MDSLVLELQRMAWSQDAPVTALVRMAMATARKLDVLTFADWCSLELNGYGDKELPAYRILQGEVQVHNPYHGWQPCLFGSDAMAEAASRCPCPNSVGELEHMLQGDTGIIRLPLPDELTIKLMQSSTTRLVPTRLISPAAIAGVVDSVRSVVLDWSLELEQKGIRGEGLTFTEKERESAASVIQIAGDFHGVVGNVQSSQVQVGDFNAIEPTLDSHGISAEERETLKALVAEFGAAKGEEKKSVAKRGMAWVSKHFSELGSLAVKITAWFAGSGK